MYPVNSKKGYIAKNFVKIAFLYLNGVFRVYFAETLKNAGTIRTLVQSPCTKGFQKYNTKNNIVLDRYSHYGNIGTPYTNVQKGTNIMNDDKEIMLRFRLSKRVYRILAVEGAKRDKKATRFFADVLTAAADKFEQRNQAEQDEWSM